MNRSHVFAVCALLALASRAGYAQDHARIYRSTNAGRSWERSDSGFPRDATVNDFGAFRNVLFAGTEADGVFVSGDGGRSWAPAGQGLPENGKVNAVASTRDAVLVGTWRDGVFASPGGNGRWRPASDGLSNEEVRRLVSHEGRVFAGTNGGLFVSDNSGRSWRHLTGEGQINGVTVLNGHVYVADLQGVLLSKDMGLTWRRVLNTGTPHNIANDGSSVFAMLYGQGVWKTDDHGATWVAAQSGLPADLGQYTFQILPVEGRLLAGQWSGVFVSEDAGASWSPVRDGLPPGQAITDLLRIGEGTVVAGAVISRRSP